MKLKLFGYDITISYYFGAMIPIALLLDATGTALWGMFAAAVHELGHLWMMHLLKCPKCQIRITVFGIPNGAGGIWRLWVSAGLSDFDCRAVH